MEIRGKKVLVFGFGLSGEAAAGLLCDQCGVSASCPENIGARQGCLQRFAIMLSYENVGNVFMRSAKREGLFG